MKLYVNLVDEEEESALRLLRRWTEMPRKASGADVRFLVFAEE